MAVVIRNSSRIIFSFAFLVLLCVACKTPIQQIKTNTIVKYDTIVKETIINKNYTLQDTGKIKYLGNDSIKILPFESYATKFIPFYKHRNNGIIDTVFDTLHIKYSQKENIFNVEYKTKIDTLRDTTFVETTKIEKDTITVPENKTNFSLYIIIALLLIIVVLSLILKIKK